MTRSEKPNLGFTKEAQRSPLPSPILTVESSLKWVHGLEITQSDRDVAQKFIERWDGTWQKAFTTDTLGEVGKIRGSLDRLRGHVSGVEQDPGIVKFEEEINNLPSETFLSLCNRFVSRAVTLSDVLMDQNDPDLIRIRRGPEHDHILEVAATTRYLLQGTDQAMQFRGLAGAILHDLGKLARTWDDDFADLRSYNEISGLDNAYSLFLHEPRAFMAATLAFQKEVFKDVFVSLEVHEPPDWLIPATAVWHGFGEFPEMNALTGGFTVIGPKGVMDIHQYYRMKPLEADPAGVAIHVADLISGMCGRTLEENGWGSSLAKYWAARPFRSLVDHIDDEARRNIVTGTEEILRTLVRAGDSFPASVGERILEEMRLAAGTNAALWVFFHEIMDQQEEKPRWFTQIQYPAERNESTDELAETRVSSYRDFLQHAYIAGVFGSQYRKNALLQYVDGAMQWDIWAWRERLDHVLLSAEQKSANIVLKPSPVTEWDSWWTKWVKREARAYATGNWIRFHAFYAKEKLLQLKSAERRIRETLISEA